MKERDLQKELFAAHDPEMLAAWRRSCVGIAGAGGLGSNIAIALARAGIQRLIVADFDTVSVTNLNRQQYFLDQEGMLKVQALRLNLSRVTPFTEVEIHALRLDPANIPDIFADADIMIEAFDAAEQKAMLIETWQDAFPQRPIIAASGLAGIGNNAAIQTHSYGNLHIIGDGCSEIANGISPVSARVAVVASMQANLCLQLLYESYRSNIS